MRDEHYVRGQCFPSEQLPSVWQGPVRDAVADAAPGDGVSTVLSGVLRGAGRQRLGAVIMAAVAWGFGLPLQTALAFTAGLGVTGMWLGAAISSTVQAVVEVIPSTFSTVRRVGSFVVVAINAVVQSAYSRSAHVPWAVLLTADRLPASSRACRRSAWHASTGTGKPSARRSCCGRRTRSRCWCSSWTRQRMRQARSCPSSEG